MQKTLQDKNWLVKTILFLCLGFIKGNGLALFPLSFAPRLTSNEGRTVQSEKHLTV